MRQLLTTSEFQKRKRKIYTKYKKYFIYFKDKYVANLYFSPWNTNPRN